MTAVPEDGRKRSAELAARALAQGYAYYLQPYRGRASAEAFADVKWRHFVQEAEDAIKAVIA